MKTPQLPASQIRKIFTISVVLLIACLQSPTLQNVWAQTPTQTQAASKLLPVIEGLNLTVGQLKQLTKLFDDTQAQLAEILTPEQEAQLKSELKKGVSLQDALKGLNTNPRQKLKMKPVLENLKTQLNAILTPEQKAQLQKLQQEKTAQ